MCGGGGVHVEQEHSELDIELQRILDQAVSQTILKETDDRKRFYTNNFQCSFIYCDVLFESELKVC